MLTKAFLWLFVPQRWTIIKEEVISYRERPSGLWEWFQRSGIRYTLQNQYGDLKFKTIMNTPDVG